MMDILYSFLSILPTSIFFLLFLKLNKSRIDFLSILISLSSGIIIAELILLIQPYLIPVIKVQTKHILTSTIYLSFIQAGMIEEGCKNGMILLIGFFRFYDKINKKWNPAIFLVSGFLALGFALIENFLYIQSVTEKKFSLFLGRSFYSTNIHFLLALLFAVFLIQTNSEKYLRYKIWSIITAVLLTVFLHGVVDFFLIPSTKIGNWLATAQFVIIWVWTIKQIKKKII